MEIIKNSYLKELDEIKKIQVNAALKTITQVDLVINYHNTLKELVKEEMIINIYGLLQSLFVAIDSLYSLAILITNSKSYININQNKTLNHLKHIRNDIVGHPVNRKYGQDGIGYSLIDHESMTLNSFNYVTYVKKGSEISKTESSINLDELKKAYLNEKEIIINRLSDFVSHDRTQTKLATYLIDLYNNYSLDNFNKVKETFRENYGNLENHRFIWRLDLIEYLINNEIISFDLTNYLIKLQIHKLKEITNDLENSNLILPYLKLPKILNKVYKYFSSNNLMLKYFNNLHDYNNPYFKSDLNYLLKTVKNNNVLLLLKTINETSDLEVIYLIGAIFKNYKIK